MDTSLPTLDPDERRWLLLLHLLFAVALAVPMTVTLVERPPGYGLTLVIAAAFGAWYAVTFAWRHARKTPHGLLVYAAGAVVFETVLILREGVYLLVLYAMLPQLFSALPRRWAVPAVSVLVLAPPLIEGDIGLNDIITLGAVLALGLVITAIVQTMAIRNDEQKEVIAALQAARIENERLAEEAAVQGRAAGVLAERQRLAHEIHDTLAQGFTSIVTQLEAAEQALGFDGGVDGSVDGGVDPGVDGQGAGDVDVAGTTGRDRGRVGVSPGVAGRGGDVAARHLAKAKRTARDGLTEARRTVEALRPRPLVDAELPAALQAMVTRWREEHDGSADVHVDGTPSPLDPSVETALVRVTQEALTNVARHARATTVTVTVTYLDDAVLLDVQDDGCGFTADTAAGGFGLTSMRERVGLVGGALAVEGVPGEGTTVAVRVPYGAQAPSQRRRSNPPASSDDASSHDASSHGGPSHASRHPTSPDGTPRNSAPSDATPSDPATSALRTPDASSSAPAGSREVSDHR